MKLECVWAGNVRHVFCEGVGRVKVVRSCEGVCPSALQLILQGRQ